MRATESTPNTLAGPIRQPRNLHQKAEGSIHNDEVATELGFRGGTVAGNIHNEQFAPLLLEVFGQEWFERGGMSMYYMNATTHEEDVQAFIERPEAPLDNKQVRVWMDQTTAGLRVLEGTARLGTSSEPSMLEMKFAQRREPGETRILADVKVGHIGVKRKVRVEPEQQQARIKVATEILDWYEDSSPWGEPICTPVTMFQLLHAGLDLGVPMPNAVGLYGAIEMNLVKGPIFVDRDYFVQGEILAKGETPKSEYLWWKANLEDESGDQVATLLMLDRLLKFSSDLYR